MRQWRPEITEALEGVVLSYHELKAAIDKRIISDVSLIPMYEEIKNHKAAIEWVRDQARQSAQSGNGAGIAAGILEAAAAAVLTRLRAGVPEGQRRARTRLESEGWSAKAALFERWTGGA